MKPDPLPPLTDPKDEPPRDQDVTFAEFLERTRRIHKLTRGAGPQRFARGLDSKSDDFA